MHSCILKTRIINTSARENHAKKAEVPQTDQAVFVRSMGHPLALFACSRGVPPVYRVHRLGIGKEGRAGGRHHSPPLRHRPRRGVAGIPARIRRHIRGTPLHGGQVRCSNVGRLAQGLRAGDYPRGQTVLGQTVNRQAMNGFMVCTPCMACTQPQWRQSGLENPLCSCRS